MINRNGNGAVNLIDVGSDGGLPDAWHKHGALIRNVLNFEPYEATRKTDVILTVPAALWRSEDTRKFYIQRGSSHGNSLYPPNLDYVREHFEELKNRGPRKMAKTWFDRSSVARTETLITTTLDTVLDSLPDRVRYDFLKVDTQGADLDIIKGAERFVREECIGIQVEAFTIPLYEGIALLPEIDDHLDARGFDRVLTAPPHGTFASQHDVLYLRRNSSPSRALEGIKRVYGLTP